MLVNYKSQSKMAKEHFSNCALKALIIWHEDLCRRPTLCLISWVCERERERVTGLVFAEVF